MSEIIIYKADQRNEFKKVYNRYTTVNNNPTKDTENLFLDLISINDYFIPPLYKRSLNCYNNHTIILLPIIGGVELPHLTYTNNFLAAEQLYINTNAKGISAINSYISNHVNFLAIIFNNTKNKIQIDAVKTIDFSIRNIFKTIVALDICKVSIGLFDITNELKFIKTNCFKGIFCFVIGGMFQVEGRLLHPKDGLSFVHNDEIKIESLLPDGVLLIIETN
jgi:quercetin 2,3-dioxygenase